MVDIKKNENKRQMYGSQSTDYHTFVSYFRIFQMSTIPRVFGLQLWNVAVLNFDMLFHLFGWWNSIYAN